MPVMKIHGVEISSTEESVYGFECFASTQQDMVKEMAAFVKYSNGRKCLLDVGGGHGIFSMVFTKFNPGSVAYCFEPDKEAYKILSKNVTPSIFTFNTALSNKDDVITMKKCAGGYSAVAEFDWEEDIEFPSMKGDSIQPILSFDTIKIDVEGYELDVLKGLGKTITQNKPIIFLELHFWYLKPEWINELEVMVKNWKYNIEDSKTNSPITFDDMRKIEGGELRIILLP